MKNLCIESPSPFGRGGGGFARVLHVDGGVGMRMGGGGVVRVRGICKKKASLRHAASAGLSRLPGSSVFLSQAS
jgi:hypothetical protein